MIDSICQSCGDKINLSEDKIGKKYKCVKCSHIVTVINPITVIIEKEEQKKKEIETQNTISQLKQEENAVNVVYQKSMEEIFDHCVKVISSFRYKIINTQKEEEAGVIYFKTGMTMYSWEGQSLKCVIIALNQNEAQLIINGEDAGGQIYSWGEAESIAKKIITNVSKIVGEESTIETKKKGCFIATSVYGSELTKEVQKFYEIRDKYLNKKVWGRWLIKGYYLFSPTIANYIKDKSGLKKLIRKHILEPLLTAWYPKTKL